MPKPYNTKNLERHINGAAPEDGGQGTAGLYRHPEAIDTATGKPAEMVTLSDPLFGEAQSNAAVQLGFVRVGDVPEGYVKHLDIQSATQAAGDSDSLKGLSARLAALEGVQDRNKALEAEVLRLQEEQKHGAKTDSQAVVDSLHDTKVAAAKQIEGRGQGDTSGVTGPAPVAPEGEQISQATTGNPADEPEETPELKAQREAQRKAEAGEEEEEETPEQKEAREADEKAADEALLAKPVADLKNSTELKRVAELENVDLTNADTNKKIRAAIQSARDKKESEKE